MRAGECFHSLRLLPAAWVVLRLDGHRFTALTTKQFTKPFDETFHGLMVETARMVLERFQGLYAYTQSDEISRLLPRHWDLFDRELEKTLSLAAGLSEYRDFADAYGQLGRFLDDLYNRERIPWSLGDLTPVEFEQQWLRGQKAMALP
jgi:tRNA(His) 5'-end guanylyltransferase